MNILARCYCFVLLISNIKAMQLGRVVNCVWTPDGDRILATARSLLKSDIVYIKTGFVK